MKKFLLVTFLVALLYSCDSHSKLEGEIEKIPVDVELVRFDKIFGDATVADLPKLKKQYPMFFPEQFADSIWELRVTDSLQRELTQAVKETFPSEEILKEELQSLFQHISYYFEDFSVPKVYTTTSDVDYRTKVIVAHPLLILELDTYLGSDHRFYGAIPKYITQNLRPGMIPSDIATAYSRQYIQVPGERSLLAQMIYFGKELYLKDLWLPNTSDADKIGYTEAQLEWAKENEAYIWSYFVEKEFLYSTDGKLPARFINPGPFSKFQLELDNESPGMIGRFIGWQIVRSYMEKNEIPLPQLMEIEPSLLFNNSKYKPKK